MVRAPSNQAILSVSCARGQLFSEHFLNNGIRHTDFFRALARESQHAVDLRRQLESAFARFPFRASPERPVEFASPDRTRERAGIWQRVRREAVDVTYARAKRWR